MMTRYAISMYGGKAELRAAWQRLLLVSQDAIWPELKRLGEAIEPLARESPFGRRLAGGAEFSTSRTG
jgi:hypothetical protein